MFKGKVGVITAGSSGVCRISDVRICAVTITGHSLISSFRIQFGLWYFSKLQYNVVTVYSIRNVVKNVYLSQNIIFESSAVNPNIPMWVNWSMNPQSSLQRGPNALELLLGRSTSRSQRRLQEKFGRVVILIAEIPSKSKVSQIFHPLLLPRKLMSNERGLDW